VEARRILAAAALALAMAPLCSHAADVKNVRSFANQDKTRVVFDLSGRLSWSQSRRGSSFSITIKSPSNARRAPLSIPKARSTCLGRSSGRRSGSNLVYTFASSRCGAPSAFMLSPRDGNPHWRLVVDFPHTGKSVAKGSASISERARRDAGKAPSQTLKDLEARLFEQYSTQGADGIRTMTPAQAAQYDAAVKKLRSDFAAEQAEDRSKEPDRVESTISRESREEVKDTAAPPKAVRVAAVARPFIIAVDPGHGGKDPGATGRRGVREKNVALSIARALYGYINSDRRMRAVLTRSNDRFVELDARSAIARRHRADLLISIHCNSTPGRTTARGTSVLLLSSNRAQRENGKILRQGSSGRLIGGAGKVIKSSQNNKYLQAAVVDMSSQNARSEGYDLAAEILKSVGRFTHIYKSRPIYSSLAVLKAPDIPSLLIETGFLSNSYEEIQLNQPNYQKQMAYRIFKGIQSYYEKNPLKNIKSRQESARRQNAQGGRTRTVTVKRGDTLSKIAQANGVSVRALQKANSLKSGNIRSGQVLVIP
jgi:N-acetylmuramoyl-L-alanine amidase